MRIEVGMITPGRAGGIYVTESALVTALREIPGVTVEVFEFGSRAENETVIERITGRARDLFDYYCRLKKPNIDIVYVNSSFNKRALVRDLGYALISRIMGVALVVKFHGSDGSTLKSWPSRVAARWIFRWSACVIVLSTEEFNLFQAQGFITPKLRVMKNAMTLSAFIQPQRRRFEPAGILFIGRFIEEKGLFDVLRAARIVADSGRQFQLLCVGDGPIRRAAEELASELGLGENTVRFTGQVSEHDAIEYYCKSTVLAFPSYFAEGLPMAVLQAAAAGLAIVSTPVRALVDYLTEPENCLWVGARNPEDLAQRLCEVLDSDDLQASMAVENRRLASHFASDVVAGEYLELFQSLVRRDSVVERR